MTSRARTRQASLSSPASSSFRACAASPSELRGTWGVDLPLMDNPRAGRIARVAALTRRSTRETYRRFLVEGPQGVREAVRDASVFIHDVYVTAAAASRYEPILTAAKDAGLYLHRVTEDVMAVMSTNTQGILAVVAAEAVAAAPLAPSAVHLSEGAATEADEERVRQMLRSARLVAVLAEAQDPGNAGTIIRCADAAGADAVILARGSVDPTNPKVVRSCAGSLFHLPVVTGYDYEQIVDLAREAGLSVRAADGAATVSLFDPFVDLSRPTAWVFGNEARGLSEAARTLADEVVSIPLYGRAESLNVATAAAVCLYASARVVHTARTAVHPWGAGDYPGA